MNEERTRDLIAAYLSGNISEQDRKDFELWVQASDANLLAFEEARSIWEHSSARLTLDDAATDDEWKRLWSTIRAEEQQESITRFRVGRYLKFAAAVALLFVAYLVIRPRMERTPGNNGKQEIGQIESLPEQGNERRTNDPPATERQVVETEDGNEQVKDYVRPPAGSHTLIASDSEVKHIYLPDSTRVWLNVNSTLSYASDFGHTLREVKLSGEAYFEVTPDAKKEFIVRGNEVSAKVLGTAFDMVVNDSVVSVIVAEGKVAVTAEGHPSVSLTPGEKAVRVKSRRLISSINTDTGFDSWRSPDRKIARPETDEQLSLVVEYSWKKNDFNQSVVTGTLTNRTRNVIYKNINLKITLVKSNGKEVTNHITVYETVLPGESTEYQATLMDMFTKTTDLRVEVGESETVNTPVR